MPRISNLPALTTPDNSDELAIVDTSASVTKKITRGDLLKAPLPTDSVTTAAITNGTITADKINTSSFSYVRASKSATQALSSGNTATVSFGTEITDVLNEYNPTTSTFTASASGLYYISSTARFTATVGTTNWNLIAIRVNSSNIVECNTLGLTAYRNKSVSTVAQLVAGDAVTIYWSNNSGASLTMDNNTASQLFVVARIA